MKNESSRTELKKLEVSQEEIDVWDINPELPPIPNGFRSRAEWAMIWNKTISATHKKLKILTNKGILEKRFFRKRNRRNVLSIPHWKLIKK